MKAIGKFLLKLLKIGAVIYAILFAVFYFDLDGKFLYFIWEPMMVKHYDKMERPDNTGMPYGKKEKVAPREYTEIL